MLIYNVIVLEEKLSSAGGPTPFMPMATEFLPDGLGQKWAYMSSILNKVHEQ